MSRGAGRFGRRLYLSDRFPHAFKTHQEKLPAAASLGSSDRQSRRLPGFDSPALDVDAGRCTRSQSNTHSIESEEVRYPWHPWYGRRVWIHEDLDKNGEGI